MKLRKLMLKDASLMLEWMHDESVIKYMQADFKAKTEEDCRKFIDDSWEDKENLHMAIVDDDDVYQGTVSLKHITDSSAEFAITIRVSAMGKGVAREAMKRIIEKGFIEKHLSRVYWCVSPENVRAVRFYDKNGYCRVAPEQLEIRGGVQQDTNLRLSVVSRDERQSDGKKQKLNMDAPFLWSLYNKDWRKRA